MIRELKNILWLCKPYWKYGRLYLFLSISVLVLKSPLDDIIYVRSPEIMINMLSNEKPFAYVVGVAAIICVVTFLKDVLPCFFHTYFTRKQEQIKLKLNYDIYQKAMHLDYKYIDNPAYYDNYAWTIQEYTKQTGAARNFIINFFKNFASIAVLVSIVASIGPWVLILEVVQMVLHTAIDRQMNQINIRKKQELIPLNRRLNYFQRLFYMKDYSADMKATPLSRKVFDSFGKIGAQKIEVETRYAKETALGGSVHEFLFCITEFIIMIYLVGSIMAGHIQEVGMYMTMMLAFYRLDSKLYGFVDILRQASELSLNAEKIRTFFEIEAEIESGAEKQECFLLKQNVSLELRNVSFSYENSDFALSNLNINILPGEKVAIVGENGVGKSTLVKLLLRLYDVQSGDILVNGQSIKAYNVHELREKIGVAFQNTNIYAMSFAENIALYGQESEGEMTEIIHKLGLDRVLEKNNVDCYVELTREFDKAGMILSGGEAQKIALARVMSRKFGLLLLDEPSSALDPLAEYEMSRLILSAANTATTIIVAHRLSTIRDVDKIILIDNGTVRESGTHEELMTLQGKYYEMFTKQAENYV